MRDDCKRVDEPDKKFDAIWAEEAGKRLGGKVDKNLFQEMVEVTMIEQRGVIRQLCTQRLAVIL